MELSHDDPRNEFQSQDTGRSTSTPQIRGIDESTSPQGTFQGTDIPRRRTNLRALFYIGECPF